MNNIFYLYISMKKELIICCLLIILVFLIGNLQNILNESFSNISNIHNCPPFSVTHKPHNSFMTHSKGWCTDKSYSMKMSPDDFDSFEKSPIKCPSDYSRVSGKESSSFNSKAFCKKPQIY